MGKRNERKSQRPSLPFARVLAHARQRLRLSRAEMAALYGASGPVISKIEHGGNIGEATIRRFAKALGMRVELRLVKARCLR